MGANSPPFKFEIFRRYAPNVTIPTPRSLKETGISPKIPAAIRIVKTGENDPIGERRESGDFFRAEIERRNANRSKAAAANINTKKADVVWGKPPSSKIRVSIKGSVKRFIAIRTTAGWVSEDIFLRIKKETEFHRA